MLPNWTVKSIGWSPSNPVKLKSSIDGIISSLNEVAGVEKDVYVTSHANELGLDLLAFLPYRDPHSSFPVVMVQCASGKDWKSKRKTPDLAVWSKVINFASRPAKGFAIPHAFADSVDFRKESVPVEGILWDRYRLLAPSSSFRHWASTRLDADLKKFVAPRVAALPSLAS
jgi:hypothetical protein